MSFSEEHGINGITHSGEPTFIRKALFDERRESTASVKTEELMSQCMRHTGTLRQDLEKTTWTCSSAEEEQVSLRKLVGMQQRQLAEMQQQLQSIQILVANLVSGNGMQAGNTFTSTMLADTATGPHCEQHLAAGSLVARGDGIRNCSNSTTSESRASCTCRNMTVAQPMTREVGVGVGESLVGFPAEAPYSWRPSCRDAAVDTSLDAEASATEENIVSRQQCMVTAAACSASLRAPEEQEQGCAAHVAAMNDGSAKHGVEVESKSSGIDSKAKIPVENADDIIVPGIVNVVKQHVSTVNIPRVGKTVASCATAVTAPQVEHRIASAFKDVTVGTAEVCSSPRLATPVSALAELETVSEKVVAAADKGSAASATTQSSGTRLTAGVATLGGQNVVCSEPSGDEGHYSKLNLKASLQSHDGPLGLLAEAVNVATGLPSCLRDSADTAGGATPPIRTTHDIQAPDGNRTSWEDLGPDSVPRICWPSSPLESDSESDLDERAVASDFGSVESSSMSGLRLGLPQFPCTGTLGGPMAMPAGPLRMAF